VVLVNGDSRRDYVPEMAKDWSVTDMNRIEAARTITELLNLDHPPIGILFASEQPDGVEALAGAVPSACALWRLGEKRLFYADAEAHFGCAVGALTMGFELPAEILSRLGDTADLMRTSGYIAPEEIEKLPTVDRPRSGIVYGPLSSFTEEPDLILMWLLPKQAMMFNEAADSVSWTLPGAPVLGRPGCSALPVALNTSRATVSMGCIGMRTFTEIPDTYLLAVLPGEKTAGFLEALATKTAANKTMQSRYEESKRALT
jgi:uncharacterized protein (DUF169 family)